MNSNTCNNEGVDYHGFSMFMDEHGNSVKRTKYTHPYSYDGFVQERCGKNEEANGTVYTDRLLQWNHGLTRKLMKKHFEDDGDYWNLRSAKSIEEFLRERLENPTLRVILVMEYCNVSNGYPVWRIDYFSEKK